VTRLALSVFALFVLSAFGCGSSEVATCASGTEGCACYPNGTCNSGLSCKSSLCVNLGSDFSSSAGRPLPEPSVAMSKPTAGGGVTTDTSATAGKSGTRDRPMNTSPMGDKSGGSAGAGARVAGSAGVVGAQASSPDYRAQLYGQPQPQECDQDEDCPTGGCCIQIGTTDRQCETDTNCTVHWTTLAPQSVPKWQSTEFAQYTGIFSADVVHSRVVEQIKTGNSVMYKLDNEQYWINDVSSILSVAVTTGDECWVVPGEYLYNMYVGTSTTSMGVRQIPVVLDTQVVGQFTGIAAEGIYQLNGVGYWRPFEASDSANRRALLATPNNLNYWMFTDGAAENPIDPVTVHADSTVTSIEAGGFDLANGQIWVYQGTPSLESAVGDHVVVYDVTLHDDEHPDLPLVQSAWVEGTSMNGQLLFVSQAQ
jgi:hypothetical protein